jgi:hypothetical protein
MLSRKQTIIMQYLRLNKSIDLDKACELIGDGIYCNRRIYVGKTLSRMVDQNHITRVKPGVFELPKKLKTECYETPSSSVAHIDEFRLV